MSNKSEAPMDERDVLKRYGADLMVSAALNIDITHRVLRTIRERRHERSVDSIRPLVAVVAASWVAALVTGVYVQQLYADWQDPLSSLVSPFVVALQ
jgi:hypothetical protein